MAIWISAGRPCDFKHQSGLDYGADIVNKVVDVGTIDSKGWDTGPTRPAGNYNTAGEFLLS